MRRGRAGRHSATLRRPATEEKGQGLVEYLMVIALVAIGLISLVELVYGPVVRIFERTNAALEFMVLR